MKLDVKELWGKAWSLRPGQNTANMKYVGTIIKSGIRFTYYQDENGGIWFDSEPVEGKPEWMQRADEARRRINDLDDDVINLFQCIRENPDELSRLVTTTPYSRKEYDYTYANTDKYFGKCEKARRVLIRCWQGYGYRTNGNKTGWKNDVQGRERAYALKKWYRLPENIEVVAERLRTVQIECRPAIDLIERFNCENVFMYLDPPYVLKTRNSKQYKHEMEDIDHEALLKTI